MNRFKSGMTILLVLLCLLGAPVSALSAELVAKHVGKATMTDMIVVPTHGERDETTFRHNVNQLKKDGHYKCFVTGATEKLEVHHIAEFSQANNVDLEKLKAFLLVFDPYGYSKAMADEPIESIDDIRNMIVIDKDHHTGVNPVAKNGIGIHRTSFPTWVAQVVSKDGANPVPQRGETSDQVMERIK